MEDRWDERDTIFSRMFELKDGSDNYKDYYKRNPEREDEDRRLRNANGGVFADRLIEQRQIDALFSLITDLRPLAGHDPDGDLPGMADPLEIEPPDAASRLKKIALSMGVLACGIAETDPAWIYSVRGRGPYYNDEVKDFLPRTLVFAVEMDEAEINRAPAVEQSAEVTKAYLMAAVPGLAIKRIINAWGYRAVCHMDGMSSIVLPPAAEAAGLGSIGLNGVLVTKERGPRIRLAAVTTDLPLALDSPSRFDVSKFCSTCGRCAASCPSGSIKSYKKYREGERFSINHETCFALWRDMATDCGVCLAVCPFSHSRGASKEKSQDQRNAPGSGFLKDFMFGRGAESQ